MPSGAPITILIIDDHPMMRQGLAQLIGAESDLSVCATEVSVHQCPRYWSSYVPNCVASLAWLCS